MKLVKRGIRAILSHPGYRLLPVDDLPPREAANLRHLAVAYEHLLNCAHPDLPIPVNETRVELLGRLLGTPPPEACAIVQALARTAAFEGDVCEFGVVQGETSAFIANEILAGCRRLHLFDSFQGLPAPLQRDLLKDDIFPLGSIEAYAGTMVCPEEQVIARLAAVGFPCDRYMIHWGFIESVIGTDPGLPKTGLICLCGLRLLRADQGSSRVPRRCASGWWDRHCRRLRLLLDRAEDRGR